MRISYWSSDVCSSDLVDETRHFDEGTSGADRAENLRVCPGRIPPRMYVGQHDPGAYDVVKVKTSFSDGGRHDLKAAPCLPIHVSCRSHQSIGRDRTRKTVVQGQLV